MVAVLVLSACAASSPPVETSTPLQSQASAPTGMIEYQEPPARPPRVTVGDVPAFLLQYQWRIDDRLREHVIDEPDQASIPTVTTSDWDGGLTLHTQVRPLIVTIRTFDSVPRESDSPEERDCTAGQGCRLVENRTGWSVVVDDPGAFTVLYAEWATLRDEDARDGVGAYRASWMVRRT